MKIARDNYEPFFLDYMEGNLDESIIDQFLDFLEQNPDLKEELQLFENVRLPNEQIIFSEKLKLYKNAADEKIVAENKLVACLEGDLDDDDRKLFEVYLASQPELQKEYNLFTKTRLIPESGITFPDKQKLYRKTGYTIVMTWVARAAAVVVLLWGIHSLFENENQPHVPESIQEIAELKPIPTPPVTTTQSEKKTQESLVKQGLRPIKESKPGKTKSEPEEKQSISSKSPEREITTFAEITPIEAKLRIETDQNLLAVWQSENVQKINDPRNIMTLDEFLAIRAKKAGNEGILSAHRLMRVGLNLASEISGQRIGYSVKNGKVTSLDFESKLMAFSIPLEKK